MRAAEHRAPRQRSRLVGPAVSVLAVLLVTAPVTWVMLAFDDGRRLADNLPNVARTTLTDDVSSSRTSDPSRGDPLGRPDTPPTKASTPSQRQPQTRPTGPASTAPAKPTASPTKTSTRPTSPTPASTSSKPAGTPTTTATTTEPPSGTSPNAYESEVLRLTNAERGKAGCGPLSTDSALTRSAGGHAEDMVDRHFFDHTNPDGKDPFERMGAAGFKGSAMAENIAMGYESPEAVVAGWMRSEGHRRNILNCGYNKLGVGYDPGRIQSGYSKGSWVQNFGTT
jgi:uncharacterized protein YkwD